MIKKNIFYIVFLLFLLSAIVLPSFIFFGSVAHAADSDNELNFDNTSVEEDLKEEISNRLKYPVNPLGTPQIIEFAEYCYSDSLIQQENYGLYMYVYNPSQIEFSEKSKASYITISTSFDDLGAAQEYSNVGITFLSYSDSEGIERLFYKFKVTDTLDILKAETTLSKTTGERRYDISGISLRSFGSASATEYKVGGSWKFKGYAKGYGVGAEEESTLDVEKTDLETLKTDVHFTYYRPDSYNNDNNEGTKDQLNSVYFTVPQRFFDDYGDIYSVLMEWWEYRTQPIWVISDLNAYQTLSNYVGTHISPMYDDNNGWSSSRVGYSLAGGLFPADGTPPNIWDAGHDMSTMSCRYAYNMKSKFYEYVLHNGEFVRYLTRPDILYNLYYCNSDSISTEVIPAETLKNDWLNYSKGKSDLILDRYARELFTTDVGEGRTAGYNKLEVCAGDSYSLTNVELNDNWFTRLFGAMYGDTLKIDGIKAIEVLDFDDSIIGDESAEKSYCTANFIDYSTFDEFSDTAVNAALNNERVVIIRFASTEYKITSACTYTYDRSDNFLNATTKDGYVALENVFLDLDIIEVTFERDGKYVVIPVVASPIDGVAGIDAPPKVDSGLPWWFWLIVAVIIILVIILLPLIFPVLKPIFIAIFKVIWWVISAPFRFIAWVVKKIKDRREAKKDVKE